MIYHKVSKCTVHRIYNGMCIYIYSERAYIVIYICSYHQEPLRGEILSGFTVMSTGFLLSSCLKPASGLQLRCIKNDISSESKAELLLHIVRSIIIVVFSLRLSVIVQFRSFTMDATRFGHCCIAGKQRLHPYASFGAQLKYGIIRNVRLS